MPATKRAQALPDGPLLAWYGNDFTGAAAVMEALTLGGLPSTLFFNVPTPAQLAKFPAARGIGVASMARAQSPAWMAQNLPPAFRALAELCGGILHYKVCSTLDSSPHIGSIGKAIEIGAQVMNVDRVPILVAAPQMRRYQCFGHLFAGMGGEVFRLDRHPVMRRHPVTPMFESDVARHLGRQFQFDFAAAHRSVRHLEAEAGRVTGKAIDAPGSGADPLIYTAERPDDVAAGHVDAAQAVNQKIGESLGRILASLVQDVGVSRAVIAGGDTISIS